MARALGIHPALPAPFKGPNIVDVLLADSATDHFKRLNAAFDRQAQRLRSDLTLSRQPWPESAPQQLLDTLRKPRAPTIGIGGIVQGGTPTVLLTTNLSDVDGAVYVGINNYAAGRSAGRLMSQWVNQRPGGGAADDQLTGLYHPSGKGERLYGGHGIPRPRYPNHRLRRVF